MVHAEVYYPYGDTELTGQDGDRRAAAQEVPHHLGRNLLGIGAHPFSTDPVVRTAYKQHFNVDLRPLLAADQRVAQGQLFQPTQATPRFGEVVQAGLYAPSQRRIDRLDLAQGLLEQPHTSAFDLQRQTGSHENHFFAPLGQLLVDRAQQVTILPAEGRVRHQPQPHFVADREEVEGKKGNFLYQLGHLILQFLSLIFQERVRHPQRHTVEHHRANAAAQFLELPHHFEGLLNGLPASAAPQGAVARNAFLHLLIFALSGRQVDEPTVPLLRPLQRIGALAAACAAEHQHALFCRPCAWHTTSSLFKDPSKGAL